MSGGQRKGWQSPEHLLEFIVLYVGNGWISWHDHPTSLKLCSKITHRQLWAEERELSGGSGGKGENRRCEGQAAHHKEISER